MQHFVFENILICDIEEIQYNIHIHTYYIKFKNVICNMYALQVHAYRAALEYILVQKSSELRRIQVKSVKVKNGMSFEQLSNKFLLSVSLSCITFAFKHIIMLVTILLKISEFESFQILQSCIRKFRTR